MREKNAFVMVVAAVGGVAISIGTPDFFSGNEFLADFMNNQYVSFLAVLVTVSMVSVVQIHLEYTRIERRFGERVFGEARKAVNLSAAVLVSLLIGSIAISFLHAAVASDPTWLSIMHVAALLTILEGIFIMYDLVETACTMAEDEPLEGDE